MTSSSRLLSVSDHHIQKVVLEIADKGYSVLKDAIPADVVDLAKSSAQSHFTSLISDQVKLPHALRGDVGAGMRNFTGYSHNNRWNLYRTCIFPWNAVEQELDLIVRLSREISGIRARILGRNESSGFTISQDGAVDYTSLSLYPSCGGFLERHCDAYPGTYSLKSLLHFKVELTSKGIDYSTGGFFIVDKHGQLVDLSASTSPTDILFFDGFQPHEIQQVYGSGIGRIALFEIPTYVNNKSRDWKYKTMRPRSLFNPFKRLIPSVNQIG